LLVAATALTLAVGCTRDSFQECNELAPGDLVITEFRGPQGDGDDLAWLEIYNASPQSIDLFGLEVRFRNLTGSTEEPILVRRSIDLASGGYAVLGLVADDESRPSYIDYGFSSDYLASWMSSSAVDLETCGVRIDRAVYDSLPKSGTYSFGGSPPDADSNDVPAMWCTNSTPDGTPQMANPPCP
jgi:hypothetical protein